MPIEDLARNDVVTADSGTSVVTVAQMMADESVGSVVVTDGDAPVGIVTDRDLALRTLAEGADPASQTAEDVMSSDLQTADHNAGFYEAANMMAEHGVRRLPVTDGDSLAGIITADDLSELLADEQQQFAAILRAQRPEY